MDNNDTNKHETQPAQHIDRQGIVSASQVKMIQTRLSKLQDRETNEALLKEHYKIESWNDLPAQNMTGLIDWFTKNGV